MSLLPPSPVLLNTSRRYILRRIKWQNDTKKCKDKFFIDRTQTRIEVYKFCVAAGPLEAD